MGKGEGGEEDGLTTFTAEVKVPLHSTLGSHRTSSHGSLIRSIPRKSSQLSPQCQHPLLRDKSRFPAGTLAASARGSLHPRHWQALAELVSPDFTDGD
jgi:hypothetical protein